jgi:lysyl endopeptidase
VTGPRFPAAAFNASAVDSKDVGYLTLSFTDPDNGRLDYSLRGNFAGVAIARQPLPGGTVPAVNYTDLWWNPSESGWGLSVTHQGRVMFLAWYVYDSGGNPVWYVASNCVVNATGSGCSGALYRTSGPAFGATFDPNSVRATEAGTVSLSFQDGNNGLLGYTVDGQSGTKAITRQLF